MDTELSSQNNIDNLSHGGRESLLNPVDISLISGFGQINDKYSMDMPVYLPDGKIALPLDAIESLVLGSNHAEKSTQEGFSFVLEMEHVGLKLKQSSLSMVLEHVVRMKLAINASQLKHNSIVSSKLPSPSPSAHEKPKQTFSESCWEHFSPQASASTCSSNTCH